MKRIIAAATISFALISTGLPSAQATLTQAGSMMPIVVSFDQKTVTLIPPSSTSPGKWTFTAANPLVATVIGDIATLVGAGYSRITAVQAASGAFNTVSRVTELTVTKGVPVIAKIPNQTVQFAANTFTIPTPSSTSNGAWSYSINGASFATLTGNVIKFTDGGTIYVTVNQAATAAWAATSLNFLLTVALIPPVLGTFGDISLNRDSVTSITLNPPSSTSTGAWTFASSDPSIATVSARTLSPIAIGTTTISATQARATPYASITVTMKVTITGTAPTVSAWPAIAQPFSPTSTKTFILNPPASSSPGTWSYSSSDPSIASIAGSVLTLTKPGIITLTANQASSGSFSPVGPITTTVTIQGTPVLTSLTNLLRVAGDPDIAITAPASASPGAITYTSSDSNIVAINGSSAKIVGAGTATITATQAASTYWLSASTTFTVQVNGIVPTLGAFNPITIMADNTPIVIAPPTSNSKGSWTFTSSDPSVAKISTNSIIGVKVGTATITAVQNPGGLFGQSNIVTAIVTVNPAPIPTPTPTPTPKPTASATPTPMPVSSSTPTPSAKPTVAPAKLAIIKVSILKRVVTVTSTLKTVVLTIDGKKSALGKHTLTAGKHIFLVLQGSTIVYLKTLIVK